MKFSRIQSPLLFHELQKLNVYKKLRSIKTFMLFRGFKIIYQLLFLQRFITLKTSSPSYLQAVRIGR